MVWFLVSLCFAGSLVRDQKQLGEDMQIRMTTGRNVMLWGGCGGLVTTCVMAILVSVCQVFCVAIRFLTQRPLVRAPCPGETNNFIPLPIIWRYCLYRHHQCWCHDYYRRDLINLHSQHAWSSFTHFSFVLCINLTLRLFCFQMCGGHHIEQENVNHVGVF